MYGWTIKALCSHYIACCRVQNACISATHLEMDVHVITVLPAWIKEDFHGVHQCFTALRHTCITTHQSPIAKQIYNLVSWVEPVDQIKHSAITSKAENCMQGCLTLFVLLTVFMYALMSRSNRSMCSCSPPKREKVCCKHRMIIVSAHSFITMLVSAYMLQIEVCQMFSVLLIRAAVTFVELLHKNTISAIETITAQLQFNC